jgi:hypothetical protein
MTTLSAAMPVGGKFAGIATMVDLSTLRIGMALELGSVEVPIFEGRQQVYRHLIQLLKTPKTLKILNTETMTRSPRPPTLNYPT